MRLSKPPRLRSRLLSAAVLLALFAAGCGIWDSVTSYFNTYYNARRAFTEAEEEIWSQPGVRAAGRGYLSDFPPAANARTKFTAVIEKCSKLLQYHPESNLVDDALMMIAKAYFYQADYQAAQRKCRELIEAYPRSDLRPEAELILAVTQYRLRDFAAAAKTAAAVIEADASDDLVAGAEMLLGLMEQNAKNYAAAYEHYDRSADRANTSETETAAFLSAAGMLDTLGRYDDAEGAYVDAINASNNYVGEYRGRMGYARMRAKQEEYRGALSALSEMRENANLREFYGEIDLETGNVLRDRGDIEDAITQYRYVDTLYARTEVSARANARMGHIYEKRLRMLDSARAVYNRGRNVYPLADVTPEMARRGDYLNRYFQNLAEISRLDSVRAALLAAQAAAPADSARADSAGTAQPDSARGSPDQGAQPQAAGPQAAQPPGAQSPGALPPGATPRAAGPQAAGPQAAGPQAEPTPGALPQAAQPQAAQPQAAQPLAAGPQASISVDSANSRLAYLQSEVATLFYMSLDEPDSARAWYEKVVTEHPTSSSAPRAMFTLAQILAEDTVAGRARSDSLYRVIVERYPGPPFSAEARRFLRMPPDSVAVDGAQQTYREAEKRFLGGEYDAALEGYRSVIAQYPASSYAPRAQYAVGWIYENQQFFPDSAVANYQRLVSVYPTSALVPYVQLKLQEVEAQRRRDAEKARQDSLRLAAAPTDSTKIALPPPIQQQTQAATPKDSVAAAPPPDVGVPGGVGRRSRRR